MSERICPECGCDIYRAANWDQMREARDRHWQKNRAQAVEILQLQLRVEELEEWRRTHGRKIERQRRTIVRLQERLRSIGLRPHEDKKLDGGEGDPVSFAPQYSEGPPTSSEPPYPSAHSLRQIRRRARPGGPVPEREADGA